MVRRKKLWEFIFTAVWNGVQITCGSVNTDMRSIAFR